MTTLCSLSTEDPHVGLTVDDSAALLASLAPAGERERWRGAPARSGVRRRCAVAGPDRLLRLGSAGERHALYAQLAPALAERVARGALLRAGVEGEEVAALLVTSSTGQLVPTLDCHLAARLDLAPTARHLSLDGLGCVGALRAVGLAADLLRGRREVALVVAVELPSLWLPTGEPGPADLQAALGFGDGGGALVVAGAARGAGPQLVASRSVLWPDSLEDRGARHTGDGLRHVVSPHLARTLVTYLRRTLIDFLAGHDVRLADLDFLAVNPSEVDVVEAIADHLDLPAATVTLAAGTWQEHGNTLAVGPLHLLRRLAEHAAPADGDLGLLLAIGPGLTCDLALLRWHDLTTEHHRSNRPALE